MNSVSQLARRTSATELSETKRVSRLRRMHRSYNQSLTFVPLDAEEEVRKPNESQTVARDETTFELRQLRAEIEVRRRDQAYREQELSQIMASDESSESIRPSDTLKVSMEPSVVSFFMPDDQPEQSESCLQAVCRSLRCQVF
jgi:hypothetical protein